MAVYKGKNGKWTMYVRYTAWDGSRKPKKKEGFNTKREAQEFEQEFLNKVNGKCDMSFSSLVELYIADMTTRLRPTTMSTKQSIIDAHILPYFKDMPVFEIQAVNIRNWQNELLKKEYAPTYLKSINTQLSIIFNYAVRYYNLAGNPVQKCGSIGKRRAGEMSFWTVDQFNKFDDVIRRIQVKTVFELLFWTGMREGELLSVTLNDFNFEKKYVRIIKSYARLNQEDLIQDPKTDKGFRDVPVPQFVLDHLKKYSEVLYDYQPDERLFPFTKHWLGKNLTKYAERAELPRIRIHDLRHSYASMLIEQDTPILLLSELLGHEDVSTTWNTYGHLYPNKHNEVLEKIEKLR